MTKKIALILIVFFYLSSCKKDTIDNPVQTSQIPQDKKLTFIFVNRPGFRNDSTKHGINDTVFQGPCIDSKYYDLSENITHLDNTCYNRNFPPNNFPTTDSITFRSFTLGVGDKIGLQVEMVWKCPTYPYTTKILRYNTKNYFLGGDTIKLNRDTVVKFIWPTDTNSGKYIKTYQWP